MASALTAWAQYRPVSGADFMNALVLGCEIECRMGNAVYPEHYAKGWHITGTTGVFGAAAAMGRVLGLDEQHMTWAIGLAASQPVGLKVQFGSDTKSFHPGRAAQNGMVSALLAQQGFTASEVAIEGFDGWGQAMSTRHDWAEVTEGLGTRYEIALNTYKPFAAGIVSHPAIDAAIQLRDASRFQAGGHQGGRPEGPSAGAEPDGQDRPQGGARRQVLHLPRGGGGAGDGPRRREGLHRRRRDRPAGDRACARP